MNLGVVAIGKEHFDESVDWSDDAYQISQTLHAGLTEEKALGIWVGLLQGGRLRQSLDFFVAATKRSQERGAVIDQVEWLNDQGLVYFQTGQLPAAENYYLQSL